MPRFRSDNGDNCKASGLFARLKDASRQDFSIMTIARIALSIIFMAGSVAAAEAAPASNRLNIVVILADDLGGSDLGCYGADLHETPNLDRLAHQAMQFSTAYSASPVCTPTRAALMTGKHPARLGMTIWAEAAADPPRFKRPKPLIPATAEHNLSHAETTVAARLQAAGYLTALVGKWHLGDPLHYPETHGFDINIGGTLWGAPQTFFYPYRGRGMYGSEFRYVPHLEFGKPGEYLTDRLTDEALNVIDRAGQQPFFLYLAHHAVHTPIEAKAADVSHFEAKLSGGQHHRNPTYAAMVKSLDDSVGRVLKRLDERGLAERTLVIFTSDNGGYIGVDRNRKLPVTDNYPLRSGKGSVYEGGVRVPLMVRWPGTTPAGSVCHEPVMTTDLFFTLLAAAGLKPSAPTAADGVNLKPVLSDPTASLNRDALYFHYPHYYETTSPVSAIRAGSWKLLHYYEDDRAELYNLADDPREQQDLAGQQPKKVRDLSGRLTDWLAAAGARLPTKNPEYQPPAAKRASK
jgi:arylsulfatase A-like enzyme